MSDFSYTIRSENRADIGLIFALTEAAFRDAPHTSHTEAYIVDALRHAGALSHSLVAELDGRLVGHIAASPVTLSAGDASWFGLGPLSVLPEFQGRGIGAQLMRELLDRLRQSGAAGCVLLGDPAYYARFGFRALPQLVLEGVPPEYFQALSFGGPIPTSTVRYHAGFEAQGD